MPNPSKTQSPLGQATLDLAQALIAKPSATPDDQGCMDLLIQMLGPAWRCQFLNHGGVRNLWACHQGAPDGPSVALVGHTDVVPTGPLEAWHKPPFEPQIEDGMLFGRGSADMKGSLAAMTVAAAHFVAQNPKHLGDIHLLVTSDEEGPAIDGVQYMMQTLTAQGVHFDCAIVGEPTAKNHVGDIAKNGRRGSLNAHMTIQGQQGHVAYPHLASNPIHNAAPFIDALSRKVWDEGTESFLPTTFQISNIKAGTGATNVIPGTLELDFNLRFSPANTAENLMQTISNMAQEHGLDATFVWKLSAQPFWTPKGRLTQAVDAATQAILGHTPTWSTDGGTSDGRFLAAHGAQVVEIGPKNATIHQVNEHVPIADLIHLGPIVDRILAELCLPGV